MGKKKNKNKVSGAVKTAAKTEKKLANKLKKELATLGEEDITKVIAEIEREEAKRSAAVEKTLPGPPSARAYATLTPHPIDNELILFGGEYHNGKQTEVYNDLLFYNPVTNVWKQIVITGGFSRVRSGRTERTYTHTDTFRASRTAGGWAWRATGGGTCARAGLAYAVNVHTDRGYVFGGVAVVDLATCRWHPLVLKHERPPPDAEMTPTPQPTAEDVTDLHKLVDWRTVIAQPKLPDWFGSDSEDDASGSESETDDSEDEE
ncbi:unnamed protein product [Leptidea sinapis]|uniref:Uncharacterized protein n=1 Tax=Leptidea sinapis TaxID=189913 RepID=A0A5E4QSF0_9NEOP|nr:unnamed protein product [Leptidea sinapis]